MTPSKAKELALKFAADAVKTEADVGMIAEFIEAREGIAINHFEEQAVLREVNSITDTLHRRAQEMEARNG